MRVNDPRGLIGVNSASQDRAKFCTAVGDAQLVEEGPPAVQVATWVLRAQSRSPHW
ncbi:hypothetical protein Pmar_PMAR026506 [Perkinsus marinus ATCC 50983]|uniref:Uncharacterized protein n=1 Tax=Perkinsus marinus (strain ATCC 50983 / TXsc) TaxID=423536 RepID=C5LDQ8_PERM5|nr:hypothetical protein Pmar_PMAR026506 [Perkinsus marinus ATCC 50983]EER05072.1 hypothetical protein Pmar_PMAR026506 [Perkinsus marinus ATCC 50983]|eukprot:XP_002773256.1 hypothetical protein Pmar_PMAR026506 [Perkinsus marinus ATCC 50983]